MKKPVHSCLLSIYSYLKKYTPVRLITKYAEYDLQLKYSHVENRWRRAVPNHGSGLERRKKPAEKEHTFTSKKTDRLGWLGASGRTVTGRCVISPSPCHYE